MTAEAVSEAAEARHSHSIVSAIRDAVLVWYAVLGGIAAWTIHLMFLTSFVQFTCNAHDYVWVMHLVTLGTLAMTAVAMLLCWRMMRTPASTRDESSDTEGGRALFLGRLGLIIGACNFALIAVEGSYVFALASRRCG
ncbi:MAG TPA: hypothetical protein VKA30_09480 [Actinomycetota bacterium]|nr:hypothetical protein [Actinomycetota bacterium]